MAVRHAIGRDAEDLLVPARPRVERDAADGLPVDPEVAAIVKRAVGTFKDAGSKVEEVETHFADTHDMIRMMWPAHYAGSWSQYLPEWRDKMDPGSPMMSRPASATLSPAA